MTGKELRRLRGRLTHEEMAVRVGVHRSTLQRAEKELAVPHLLALAVTHVLRCRAMRRKRAGEKGKA